MASPLSGTEKVLVGLILAYQDEKIICRESNSTLAYKLGPSVSTINKTINSLKKYDFFNYNLKKTPTASGGWLNYKTLKIDVEKLETFLEPSPKCHLQ